MKTPSNKQVENDKTKTTTNSNQTKGVVVVISRDTMGEGAMELGKILIKSFIYSLTELHSPPKCVIFLNSGAYLTSAGSNTIDDLKELENKGVEILTCGTCVNYYELQDKLAVGAVTDMVSITARMDTARNIINI
ncbi:MAG: sulfurtransferase-like selenium metabolism protein YedF [Clostridiales bacterium]|nr:sulfurtransferase-like selenium metabolism protein YedF [Clostridiales bacterium]